MTFSIRKQQGGMSMVLAIFVLVVMSLLGAAMVNILRSGSDSVAREVVSLRALMAAESGAQRLLNEIFPPGGATLTGSCGDKNYAMNGLFACNTVDVSCQVLTIDSVDYFTISSTGRCGPLGDESVRVIQVQAKGI
ncbi:MAG: MSHA biogenesis protein MshP [Gammaproteobacteria bacterium]|jgi:MSHA biogenesis protein MshP